MYHLTLHKCIIGTRPSEIVLEWYESRLGLIRLKVRLRIDLLVPLGDVQLLDPLTTIDVHAALWLPLHLDGVVLRTQLQFVGFVDHDADHALEEDGAANAWNQRMGFLELTFFLLS
jgi:hypothetical protein